MNAIQVFEALDDGPAMYMPAGGGGMEASFTMPHPAAHEAHDTHHAADADMETVTLRRSGERPFTFTGRHLGLHTGYRVGTPIWHELNLWHTADGNYVTDIRVYSKAQGGQEQFHVAEVETLEAALQIFESYDARRDVVADFDLDDPDMAPAEMMAHAAALRYRIADAVSQYRSVLAVFLTRLNDA